MPIKLKSPDLRHYALAGAKARLLQIAEEAAAIYRAFPELRADGIPGLQSGGRAGRTMSAEQRKAVGERMRKYWAARRQAKAAQGKAVATSGAQRGRRKMSAAARKRISAAQKARWAKQKNAG